MQQSQSASHIRLDIGSSPSGVQFRQELARLHQNQRDYLIAAKLVQSTLIRIRTDGSFDGLSPQVAQHLQLIMPAEPSENHIVTEIAQIFYSRNVFQTSLGTLKDLVAWNIRDVYHPSHFITNMVIEYGTTLGPVGNAELAPTLSMSSLQNLCIVFQDAQFKGLGPSAWLRPSAHVILKLKERLGSRLTLRLSLYPRLGNTGISSLDRILDFKTLEGFKDVTEYLEPATEEEEWELHEIRRIVRSYKGNSPMVTSILHQAGWKGTHDIERLTAKVNIRNWGTMEGENEGDEDVEMT